MGRRKRASSKNKKTFGTDLFGGILVVLGLVLLVFLSFSNAGSLASILKNVFMGLFSYSIYILPAVLVVVGVYVIVDEKKFNVAKEISKGIMFLTFFSSLLYVFTESNFSIFDDFAKYITTSYQDGIAGHNTSGVIGAFIGGVLVQLIGVLASKIVLFFITAICIMYFLNISIKQIAVIIYNVFALIGNVIYDIFTSIFRKDDELEFKEQNSDRPSIFERRRNAKEQKEKERLLKEKGSLNVDKNLRADNIDQIEFDFNKLGGKLNETELQAKQQRDEFFKKEREQKEDKNIKEVLTLDHTKLYEEHNYIFPPMSLLTVNKSIDNNIDRRSIHATATKLQRTLASFSVDAKVTNITKGPTVTRYELTPNTGVKVSSIVNLADDIALNLAAKSIRIEAPIPGRAAVGIEVPNEITESVLIRDLIESEEYRKSTSPIAVALGKNTAGDTMICDIEKMPHLLIAGATGSGKSVGINSFIVSILYKSKPSDVKMMLIDPKMVELSGYNGIPHLLIPVVTDPKKAAGALNWAVQEMIRRYNLFASKGVKEIKGYNKVIEKEVGGVKLPQIVIIIDELADLMMVAKKDVEDAICRLAQMARAAGMHLVVATQRPSVDVITGLIKANIPSRIAFTVSSQIDSRTILDSAGAEKLLGKGDMLYFPVGENKPQRIQGAYVSEKEIESIVENIKANNTTNYSEDIIDTIEKVNKVSDTDKDGDGEEDIDPLLNDAINMVVDMGSASASMLQRRFKIGYSRAGRIVDQMEARGLVSGYDGSKPRQVLISKDEWQEIKFSTDSNDTANDADNNKNINENME